MNRAMWIAKTGLDAQQTRLANISNNLANVSTSGFKRSRAVFEDLLYQNVRQVGAQSSQDTQLPSGLQLGTGTMVVANEKLFTQGNFVQTENPLDIAIEGRGFFQILLPDGTIAYTRDGSFQLSADGGIVSSTGLTLEPAITVPADALSITIGADGTISAVTPGSTAPTQLGNLQLADFVNPAGLQAIGKNLFIQSGASGDPQTSTPGQNGVGTVVQGTVESSNVNVVEEMVNMIETQRAYEMNSKAIATADQMLQFVNQTL